MEPKLFSVHASPRVLLLSNAGYIRPGVTITRGELMGDFNKETESLFISVHGASAGKPPVAPASNQYITEAYRAAFQVAMCTHTHRQIGGRTQAAGGGGGGDGGGGRVGVRACSGEPEVACCCRAASRGLMIRSRTPLLRFQNRPRRRSPTL